IYYAFKQTETTTDGGTTSTGWATFLEAVIRAGFSITGTWPIRTERSNRLLGIDTNALASSIVLVCRPRPTNAPTASRRAFVAALQHELPAALRQLQQAAITSVDLAQAAIGPGMAVFTRYARVENADGSLVTVSEALALINQVLDETLAAQEGDFDAETRWAIAWFSQYGFDTGEFGVAETLSKAKNTSIDRLVAAGMLEARRGQVRLRRPADLPELTAHTRLTDWMALHVLIRALQTGGEQAVAERQRALGSQAGNARELAYRLYTVCDRRHWAEDGFWYNALIKSWAEISVLAQLAADQSYQQTTFTTEE
ncbi:MAG: hypothetical protein K6356_09575, partial [Chloroflexus sp.]